MVEKASSDVGQCKRRGSRIRKIKGRENNATVGREKAIYGTTRGGEWREWEYRRRGRRRQERRGRVMEGVEGREGNEKSGGKGGN